MDSRLDNRQTYEGLFVISCSHQILYMYEYQNPWPLHKNKKKSTAQTPALVFYSFTMRQSLWRNISIPGKQIYRQRLILQWIACALMSKLYCKECMYIVTISQAVSHAVCCILTVFCSISLIIICALVFLILLERHTKIWKKEVLNWFCRLPHLMQGSHTPTKQKIVGKTLQTSIAVQRNWEKSMRVVNILREFTHLSVPRVG